MVGLPPNKVPLRSLSNLFSQLPTLAKTQLQAALGEAEDQLNSHNTSVVDNQQRRSLSGLVSQPVLTVTTNNRGFDVQWDRLDDKTISMYEVQISTDSIFSNPDVYRVVDTSFALEGVGTVVYGRVRGVRFDGQCSLWSDTATINATAESSGPVVYSVGFDNVRQFYKDDAAAAWPVPIQKLVLQSQRQNGGIMVFGSFGTINSEVPVANNFVRMRLNTQILSSFDMTSLPMDGQSNLWSVGLGPTFLTHSQFYFSVNSQLNPETEASSGSSGGSGTGSGWNFNGNGAIGTMETTVPLTGNRDNCANYSVGWTALGQSHTSKHLHLTNFGFAIPSVNTILGIKLRIATAWGSSNTNENKSFPYIHNLFLIDGGTDRPTSFLTADTTVWPRSLPYTLGADLALTTFGGPTNLWNEAAGFWTPAKINASNFGFSISSKLRLSSTDATASAYLGIGGTPAQDVSLFGAEMTVYSENPTDRTVQVDIQYFIADGLGNGGQCTDATINVIEFGDAIS